MKIYVASAPDRDQMVMILARNGYTVRIDKEKPTGANKYQVYVEIEEKGEKGGQHEN